MDAFRLTQQNEATMKKILITLATASLAAATIQAGPMAPAVMPSAPVPSYGVGSYFALQGGINAYQEYEGTERASLGGTSVALEAKEKIGGFGGIKWGYGWDGNVVKPALELDAFYNGADYDVEARVAGSRVGSVTGRFDTGAFLINGLLRFDTGSSFLPYVGVGVGGWFGQVEDTRVSISGVGSARVSSGDTNGDLALQALAGCDWFFNPSTSLFLEYKYLNYFGVDLPSDDPLGQHLVGVGVRWMY